MTVSSSVNKVIYSGNSATVLFPVSYYFLENSHLKVILRAADGTETVQALTTNYTVTGAGNPAGGSVTMLVAPPTGTTLTIVRNVPATQETDYLANDPFPAESHERALDKLTMLVQENEEVMSRALVVPASTPLTVSTTLPNPISLGILAWNQNANAINYISPSDIGTAVAYATAYADTFNCDGIDQTFTLTANPVVINNLDVSINGSTQVPNVDYTLSGTTLTMTTPPPINSVLLAKYKQGLPNFSGDSQDIRYVPAGSGAVNTTVQTKLRETVSVKDFGAVGDGVADDTAAIQAAIAALTRGQTLYIPKGAYVVTTTLTINKSINIVGESKFDSIIYGSGFTTDETIIDFTGTTSARIQDLRMENISIWSNNNLARGLSLSWVNKSSFSNLYFYNLYRGVFGDNAWSNNWKNVSAFNITTELFKNDVECNNLHFDKVEFRGSTGISIIGNTAAIKFTACDFEGITSTSGYGCNLAPVTGKTISGVVFDGCYFENIKGAAIGCNGVDANSIRGLVVKGCYFFGGRTLIFGTAGTAVNAIELRNVSGFQISENMFIDWQDNVIFRDSTEFNGSVENNVIEITPALTNSSNLMSASVAIRNNTYGRKEQYLTSVPASGSYSTGDFVWNITPSLDVNNMFVLGWSRATTGSGHVVGTDWLRAYVSQLSPAT